MDLAEEMGRVVHQTYIYSILFFFLVFFVFMIFIEAQTVAGRLVGLSYTSLGFVCEHTQTKKRCSSCVILNSKTLQILKISLHPQ